MARVLYGVTYLAALSVITSHTRTWVLAKLSTVYFYDGWLLTGDPVLGLSRLMGGCMMYVCCVDVCWRFGAPQCCVTWCWLVVA